MPKASKKKGSLISSLKAHQAKVEAAAKKKAQEAAYAPNRQPNSDKKSRRTALANVGDRDKASLVSPSALKKGKGKPTVPFHPSRQILLVGEGNFSFALSLITTESISITPPLLIATSYDSEVECYRKYPEAKSIVEQLRSTGAHVYFDVDATKLHKHKELRKLVYDTIVFNYPHVGAGIKDQDRNIVVNQRLIIDFLQSIAPLLSKGKDPSSIPGSNRKKRKRDPDDDDEDVNNDDAVSVASDDLLDIGDLSTSTSDRIPPLTRGSVLITLRDAAPYTLWDITRLAKNSPSQKHDSPPSSRYKLVRSFRFHPEAYKGYEHRRTIGGATGLGANEDLQKGQGVSRTWEFVLKDEEREE